MATMRRRRNSEPGKTHTAKRNARIHHGHTCTHPHRTARFVRSRSLLTAARISCSATPRKWHCTVLERERGRKVPWTLPGHRPAPSQEPRYSCTYNITFTISTPAPLHRPSFLSVIYPLTNTQPSSLYTPCRQMHHTTRSHQTVATVMMAATIRMAVAIATAKRIRIAKRRARRYLR